MKGGGGGAVGGAERRSSVLTQGHTSALLLASRAPLFPRAHLAAIALAAVEVAIVEGQLDERILRGRGSGQAGVGVRGNHQKAGGESKLH